MRYALLPLLLLASSPAFARGWFSRTCGRMLGERPTIASPALRVEYDRVEDEISRTNRFSSRHLSAAIEHVEFLDDEPWGIVLRGRERAIAYATTPGQWTAVVSAAQLEAMVEEAAEIKKRNDGLNFELKWKWWKRGILEVWLEGELTEAQRTRVMLVMLQYVLETSDRKL